MSPPLIYVAGPFRGPTPWAVAENVRAAERVGLAVAFAGGMPVIPHANTHLFDGQVNAAFWLEGTMAMLRVCHGAVFLPTWVRSEGSKAEMADVAVRGAPHMILPADPSIPIAGLLRTFIASIGEGQ